MNTCNRCNKRPATAGYKRCDVCRERERRNQRATYDRWHRKLAPTTAARALRVLGTLVLTPCELADVLHITPQHAAVTLQRLHQRGHCRRFLSGRLRNGRSALRYQLRDL